MKFSQIVGLIIALLIVAGFSACGGGESDSESAKTGTLSLNLTDAPLVDEDNVTGVYINITAIEYHTEADGWQVMKDFNKSVNPINLLDWQDGKSISLGDFQLPAGKYTQMRFKLDAPDESIFPQIKSNIEYSSIEFDGDSNETLYVPSGTQTGYKAIGNFEVPVNGTVVITADFDVRKSVIVAGNGKYYKLKPTIKLVVTEEAGSITGKVTNLEADAMYIVYAYENPSWNDDEANDPEPSDSSDIRFANAATSSVVKADGTYTLSFLKAGTYDLVVAKYDAAGEYQTNYLEDNISVESNEVTTSDISL